ncbi:hypothetical protein HK405_015565, partial [Cladochytrium tenue]
SAAADRVGAAPRPAAARVQERRGTLAPVPHVRHDRRARVAASVHDGGHLVVGGVPAVLRPGAGTGHVVPVRSRARRRPRHLQRERGCERCGGARRARIPSGAVLAVGALARASPRVPQPQRQGPQPRVVRRARGGLGRRVQGRAAIHSVRVRHRLLVP